LKKEKHEHPKYCVKMATGTGKTWVLSALLIWQYLNAKNEETQSGRFSKNFLIVAPGIIVYERLLDAYLGKRREDGTRNFDESDLRRFEHLFVPPAYKDEIFGFVQSCVSQKDEIGRKVTGDGLIAITNWHLLAGDEEEDDTGSPLDSPAATLKELLPITPGTTAGHSLNELDNRYLRGRELDFLSRLPDLVVFNDEAHHLGELKKSDEVLEKKWQDALDEISGKKGARFIQIDFSATPYTITGSGQKRTRHFFPHIIVNFELVTAIRNGLVKTVAIDKRKELAAMPLESLDFKADRDGKTILLSDGQRTMLRAGLSRLRILEEGFAKYNKHPKMLIVCEDTKVVGPVNDFLRQEGLAEEEIMEIHSNRKGDIGQDEWEKVKQHLFSIDKSRNPKVIVSVLMLREGFDVNNICVIVPLRATSSYILLEQTIGRGLRLMWREPQYEDSKRETREKLLVKKEEPDNYMDILSIVEHPAFVEFYETELSGAIGTTKELPKRERVVGDIISVELKSNFRDYDFYWPIIVHDKEEHLTSDALSLENLELFPIKLEDLKPLVNRKGDIFYGEELTVKTKFGEYSVTADIFTAKSYNSFLQKIVNAVSTIPVKIGKRTQKNFPLMQINSAVIAKLTDDYIRHRLFGQEFDPLEDNNWRILILTQEKIIQHIVRNISQSIYDLQNRLRVVDATIIKRQFSEISEIKIRETYAIEVAKTIYSRIAYPSNKGGFEKAFIEFIDSDSKVKAFVKINEHYCDFANILYIREDGMLAHYFPDFMVRIGSNLYIVETKAERDLNNVNVKQKRLATIDWIDKVNELQPQDRMGCTWHYVLLGERTFYDFSSKGATTEEILKYALMTREKAEGKLTGFMDES
jgi:type III restriction enzyme